MNNTLVYSPKVKVLDDITLVRASSFEHTDTDVIKRIIEDSLQARLVPDYFAESTPDSIWVAEKHGRPAGVLVAYADGYMDKFAVTPEFQKNGVGRALFNEYKQDYPEGFWRSRPTSNCHCFYEKNAQDHVEDGTWIHYFMQPRSQDPDFAKKLLRSQQTPVTVLR